MDSYVVRIYRRDEEYPRVLAGIVEIASSGEEKAFGSLAELMSILTGGDSRTKTGGCGTLKYKRSGGKACNRLNSKG
jgi:hypothetical protein